MELLCVRRSMLDLTGEEQTITITADTVITKQASGMAWRRWAVKWRCGQRSRRHGQNSDSS